MKSIPLLFSGPEVRAILRDVKTLTIRPVKRQPIWAETRDIGGGENGIP